LATGCGSMSPSSKPTSTPTLPTISERVRGFERLEGLLTIYRDARAGKLWAELPAPDAAGIAAEFLYVEGLRSGLGSNPVGLDRGQLGPTRLVRFRRVGPKIFIEHVNLRFRAQSEDMAERRAVEQSFADLILWGGDIAAEGPDGSVLIDLTSFVVRDAHDVVATLERTGQGTFKMDAERSSVDLGNCLVFPENLEFEALLTYGSEKPGPLVRSTVPNALGFTLVQHHSLIRLPDDGYRPRRFDPRAGSFAVEFDDYAAPLEDPLRQRWIVRHRLQKLEPGAERSKVREPIIYYVDRGVPEPVRSALVDGAAWWAEAFEAAGFVDAFRVELLPQDAHPLDARYNVIQWVHRATRGWSYGG
jgi:hypothetical protein